MSSKKLIEVALPLDAINKASAREKSIRHGHPSTLHLWWARRPLAAARAVIFAQMVDDPSAHPDLFPTEKAQEKERQRLFRIRHREPRPRAGKLRFIEVKGRITGAETITVTRNEILYSVNKPEDFILAIVEFAVDDTHRVHYVRRPFPREPDFGAASVNYDFGELLACAEQTW